MLNKISLDGLYKGIMTDEIIQNILDVVNAEYIEAFKYMIFNFPLHLISRSLTEERAIRDIIKEESLDFNDYIGILRDYQTVAVGFMYLSMRSILGDGVGLGKTATTAGLLNYLYYKDNNERFLMVVENTAITQIHIEMIRFTGLRIIVLPSQTNKMERAIKTTDWRKVDGVITAHQALRSALLSKWLSIYLTDDYKSKIFNTLILDESSAFKNNNTKIVEYTKNIVNIIPRVHFLNATTFETNIMDIYNQVNLLDDRVLPKRWEIEKLYCKFAKGTYWTKENGRAVMKYKRDLIGYKNQDEFKKSLRLYYLGRSKTEKTHTYKVYKVIPSNEQMIALSKGHRHMEVLNCPILIPELGIGMTRKYIPKLDKLVILIQKKFIDSKIMIYCFHIEAQKALKEELLKIGRKSEIINGKVKEEDRWNIVNDFNSGECDVLITNIQKSLNLPGADVCIFYSFEANPARMIQIAGRVDRNVDEKTKTYILLLYSGTDEFKLFVDVAQERSRYAKELIASNERTTVDFFIEDLDNAEILE